MGERSFRYVVFYLPFDFGYKVLKFLPIKLAFEALREVLRSVLNDRKYEKSLII